MLISKGSMEKNILSQKQMTQSMAGKRNLGHNPHRSHNAIEISLPVNTTETSQQESMELTRATSPQLKQASLNIQLRQAGDFAVK